MEEFRVNELIILRLIDGKTIIYVNNKEFEQCKHLLLNVPMGENLDQEINSIDDAEEYLKTYLEETSTSITPEEEFMGHCSNLQAWAENQYNTTLLHRTLAFPLLKVLSDEGDTTAKHRFKEDIARRYKYGNFSVQRYLFEEGYLRYLTNEDILTGILAPQDALFMEKVLSGYRRYSPIPYIDLMRKMKREFLLYSVREGNIWDLELQLDGNLTSIPDGIENLTELNRLTLFISYPSPNFFGEEFKAPTVQTLRISCDVLNLVIPDLFWYFPNLERLEIQGYFDKSIVNFEKSFCRLPNLKTLYISDVIFEELPDTMGKLKNLESLRISSTNLQHFPLKIIDNLESLRYLYLSNNKQLTIPKNELKELRKKIRSFNYFE